MMSQVSNMLTLLADSFHIAEMLFNGTSKESSPDETWSHQELSAPQVLTTSTGLWCMACAWGRPRSRCSDPAAGSGCMTCPARLHSLSSFSQHPTWLSSKQSFQSVGLQKPVTLLYIN